MAQVAQITHGSNLFGLCEPPVREAQQPKPFPWRDPRGLAA
jgi:hypothetical protein